MHEADPMLKRYNNNDKNKREPKTDPCGKPQLKVFDDDSDLGDSSEPGPAQVHEADPAHHRLVRGLHAPGHHQLPQVAQW